MTNAASVHFTLETFASICRFYPPTYPIFLQSPLSYPADVAPFPSFGRLLSPRIERPTTPIY
jgi:hypothetical protein